MKKYNKRDIERLINDIITTIKTMDDWKVENVYIYENDHNLYSFVLFAGQGLLQFIYDDIKNHNETHTYNWKDITYLLNEYSKKDIVEQLYEEFNKREKD